MLAKLGYHVVALTGKESESDWLKKLGAKEVMLAQAEPRISTKIKPLDKATWAGAVDNLGGRCARLDREHHEGHRRRSPRSGWRRARS